MCVLLSLTAACCSLTHCERPHPCSCVIIMIITPVMDAHVCSLLLSCSVMQRPRCEPTFSLSLGVNTPYILTGTQTHTHTLARAYTDSKHNHLQGSFFVLEFIDFFGFRLYLGNILVSLSLETTHTHKPQRLFKYVNN